MSGPKRTDLLDRMADKFLVGDGCWPWTAYVDPNGYGRIGSGGHKSRSLLAHRVMYEMMVGPIPDGLTLDHLCRNRRCIRPDHLEPCSRGENVTRGAAARLTCRRGHPWASNSYIRSDGYRQCRRCHAEDEYARRHREEN